MSSDRLPLNATLADIVGTPAYRAEFVRRAFDNMHNCGLDRERVRVRVGRMGTGQKPFYKLDDATTITGQDYETGETVSGELSETTDKIYRGDNHKQVRHFGKDEVKEFNWSRATMKYAEVQALMVELRNAAKTKRS